MAQPMKVEEGISVLTQNLSEEPEMITQPCEEEAQQLR